MFHLGRPQIGGVSVSCVLHSDWSSAEEVAGVLAPRGGDRVAVGDGLRGGEVVLRASHSDVQTLDPLLHVLVTFGLR